MSNISGNPEHPPVLLVEDDDGHARLTERSLAKNGFTTRREATGAGCLRAVEESLDWIVLLDLGLPDVNRFEALDHLIACSQQLPVIVVTGNDDLNVAVEALRRGAWDYVVKRPDLSHLQELPYAIERNFERQRLVRERNLFRSMLSHDIRNPLNIIYNYADMVGEEIALAPGARELLQRIKDNALTTLDLVSNFVELGRIESGKLTLERRPLCLSDLVRDVVDRHTPMALNQKLALRLDVVEEMPHVEADRAYMERVVANLVNNAIKFTPRGGTVSVRVRSVEGGVRIDVRDSGPGIPLEEQGQIFEKYRRGNGSSGTEGTGLGLFIVRSVVEAHGGAVDVESCAGAGATFSLTLPFTRPPLWENDAEVLRA